MTILNKAKAMQTSYNSTKFKTILIRYFHEKETTACLTEINNHMTLSTPLSQGYNNCILVVSKLSEHYLNLTMCQNSFHKNSLKWSATIYHDKPSNKYELEKLKCYVDFTDVNEMLLELADFNIMLGVETPLPF